MQIKDYIKYKVKTGDTLKSLAMRIGLNDYKELRNFHNEICSESTYLKTTEITKENVLYMPNLKEVISINENAKQLQEDKKSIDFLKLQFSKLTATYNIKIIKENITGTQKKKNSISYKLSINYIKTKEYSHIFKIEKNTFLVNNKTARRKIQQLAIMCSNVYYPMEIAVNDRGKIITIHNILQIKERWLAHKIKIKEVFNGKYVDAYIKNLEFKIMNTKDLEVTIKNDTVIKAILFPYKKTITQLSSDFSTRFLKDQINYEVKQKIDIKNTTEKTLVISQSGIIKDPRNYRDTLKPNDLENPYTIPLPKIEGTLESLITIDMQNAVLKKITANYEINYTPSKIKNTQIDINLVK